MRRLGIGYRRELARWIDTRPAQISCLEITAEHFFDAGEERLKELRRDYPLFVHGLGLSLGTPGPLDAETLAQFVRVVKAADPLWISEHVAFTRTADVDLGHLNPVLPTEETLAIFADHARELLERCNKPLILENITSHLRLDGTMPETEFLNRLCDRSGCGLLLDVTNLYINARNHNFDPEQWLHEIDPKRIVQLHVVGYSKHNGRWEDLHAEAIQEDLLVLIANVLDYAPVQAVIVERDHHFPSPVEFAADLELLQAMLEPAHA
ncbi:MAG: DUF692 domain-containing protein [Gammaproteobacteria bacterium]|nr:DUF692 domain-containing protein [Gammaproteobacteria bacterium]